MTLIHKYWKTAALSASGHVGDNPLFLLDYLLRLLRVGVLLALWRIILAGEGMVSGMSLDSVLTYTLIAEVFRQQLNCRTEIQSALWSGRIGNYYLRPVGVFGQFAAQMFGEWLFNLAFFSLPLALLAPLFGVNPLPAEPQAAVQFLLSLGLAISVGLALELFFGALVVYLDHNVYNAYQLREAFVTLLSGALLPLPLLPWNLGEFFAYLPFAATASAPLLLYIGVGDPGLLLPLQAFWSAVLWLLAFWFWRLNRERLVCHGG